MQSSLGSLFEALSNPVLVMNTDWSIAFANQAALELFGYERVELEQAHVDRLVPEQLRERYRSLRDGASQAGGGGVLLQGERILCTKDGREFPAQLSTSRVTVGGAELLVSSLFDISAQKEAEQETIERLYSIVEHSDVSQFLIQVTEDGAFLFESFNAVTERLTGVRHASTCADAARIKSCRQRKPRASRSATGARSSSARPRPTRKRPKRWPVDAPFARRSSRFATARDAFTA